MRASVIHEFDRPWRIEQLPDPVPAAGQVLICVHASGLCGTDVHVHHGYLPVSAPLVAGHEPVGEVVAVGEGVTWPVVGDRVGVSWIQRGCGACRHCGAGRETFCDDAQTWMDLGGGNAELMLAWAEGCTALPDGLAYELAAPTFCAGFTVLAGLRAGQPLPGERVAILGLGGLGHLAIQYAKALGHETLALTSSDEKCDDARDLGADDAVTVDDHPGRALEDAGGADVVLCTSNSALQVSQVVTGLNPRGRLVNVGFLDGPVVLDMNDMLYTHAQVKAVTPSDRRDLLDALAMVADGRVAPIVETFALEDHNRARERLEAGRVRYRAVLLHAT
jgi:D-arabinose 1-dehydrogenase-like Zn-dependent alcohol dehydrogenase